MAQQFLLCLESVSSADDPVHSARAFAPMPVERRLAIVGSHSSGKTSIVESYINQISESKAKSQSNVSNFMGYPQFSCATRVDDELINLKLIVVQGDLATQKVGILTIAAECHGFLIVSEMYSLQPVTEKLVDQIRSADKAYPGSSGLMSSRDRSCTEPWS